MSVELFDSEGILPSQQHAEAQALKKRIYEKLPSIYSNQHWHYKCKEFLVTVEYDSRGFVATAVARLEYIRTNCYLDNFEHKHGFLTATSPRGGMEALEELDAKARRMKKGKLCEYLRSGCAAGVM